MKKNTVFAITALAACFAFAEPPPPAGNGRASFANQQAYNEMMRVGEQVDVVQANVEHLSERLNRLEGGKGEIAALKSEIDSLRADIASVRREMQRMRDDITKDLTRKIVEISKANRPAPVAPTPPPQPTYTGPVKEYRVVSGDTLSLIAQAFGTTVPKIREINGLKSDSLRIGQRILVPKN